MNCRIESKTKILESKSQRSYDFVNENKMSKMNVHCTLNNFAEK